MLISPGAVRVAARKASLVRMSYGVFLQLLVARKPLLTFFALKSSARLVSTFMLLQARF